MKLKDYAKFKQFLLECRQGKRGLRNSIRYQKKPKRVNTPTAFTKDEWEKWITSVSDLQPLPNQTIEVYKVK